MLGPMAANSVTSQERASQFDLALWHLADAPVKQDRALLEYPFFSLQKQPQRKTIIYEDLVRMIRIEIMPSTKGAATIWDKDLLMYIASVLNERIAKGLQVGRTFRFAVYDFLKAVGRADCSANYRAFEDALDRLAGTRVKTTIPSADRVFKESWGWINSWKVVTRMNRHQKEVAAGVEITLSEWCYSAIVEERRLLSINKEYFRLEKGLERRLYELARKHCGNQASWKIGLSKLSDKCGTKMPLKAFRYELAKIAASNNLPDYTLHLAHDQNSPAQRALRADGYKLPKMPLARIIVVFSLRPSLSLKADAA